MTASRRPKPNPRPIVDAGTTVGASDLDLLPQLFRLFASEVRDSLARLERIIPAIERIDAAIHDLRKRVHELEQERHEIRDRLVALEGARSRSAL